MEIKLTPDRWKHLYFMGDTKRFMQSHYDDFYNKFYATFLPPKEVEGKICISDSHLNNDVDYAKVVKVTEDFCEKYPTPFDFPESL